MAERVDSPSERDLREFIEGRAPELVRGLFAEACVRGEPGTGESLLVAGAVSDLLLGVDHVPPDLHSSGAPHLTPGLHTPVPDHLAPGSHAPGGRHLAPTHPSELDSAVSSLASEAQLAPGSEAQLAPPASEAQLAPRSEARLAPGSDAPGAQREHAYELIFAAWEFLGRLPRRDLNVKWLRQLPREDRSFLYVRSLEEVFAEASLEEAALRLSVILRAVQDAEQRNALFLEAAAWTPGSGALAMVQAAVAALGESTEESRPFWLRMLECIYAAGSDIPLRTPASASPLGWEELSRVWPSDPAALIVAWIERPRWWRAIHLSGAKSPSVRLALARNLERAGVRVDATMQTNAPPPMNDPDPFGGDVAGLAATRHAASATDAAEAVSEGAKSAGALAENPALLHWARERDEGRAHSVLEALRSGRPRAFLVLASLCTMRDVPPAIDERILARTYRALETIG